MTFASDYKRMIGPRLRKAARWHGLRVALQDTSYSDAVSEVMGEACRFGATSLPHPLLDDLHGEVMEWVMHAVEEFIPEVDAAHHLAGEVARDIAVHDAKFAGLNTFWPARRAP